MPATFQGNTVTVLRPATNVEPGFKEGAGECVLIRMSDGTEKIVPKSDVKDSTAAESDVGESHAGEPLPKATKAVPVLKHKVAAAPHRKK